MTEIVEQACSTCNTCKISFPSTELVREHYRDDWHIFNSKRRGNGLAPVSKKDFLAFLKSTKPKSVSGAQNSTVRKPQTPAGISVKEEIKMSRTQKDNSEQKDIEKFCDEVIREDNENSINDVKLMASKLDISCERADTIIKNVLNKEQNAVNEEDGEEEVSEEQSIQEIKPLPVDPTISLFDQKRFQTIDECVDYMTVTYGFFIPDKEYLVDLPGLLTYLGEKVKLGGICLYCQKQCTPGYPCQLHMISKSHCKIAYEEDIDIEEFDDFYDFFIDEEDDGEEVDEDDNGDDESEADEELVISPTGELVLPDGRILGHRAFKRYYKQKFRSEDNRPAVLAQKREYLLRIGSALGGGSDLDPEEIQRLSDAQLVAVLMKQRRELRKSQMIEQRARQRYEFVSQRREYQSTVDKLRSSATTTAKIRDWHKVC